MSLRTPESARTAPFPAALAAAVALVAALPAGAAGPAYVSHAGLDPTDAANGESRHVTSRRLISADGRWVAFASKATDLWGGVTDANGTWDTFVEDRDTGVTILVSHASQVPGVAANGESQPRAISADGRFVAFSSLATNLVSGITDSNSTWDAFVWDRNSNQVTLLSRSALDPSTTAGGGSHPSRITADGAWVLLRSLASDLDAGQVTDANSAEDVFLWERATGELRLVSHVPPTEPDVYTTGNGASSPQTMSADGSWVAYLSAATDLLPGLTDGNGGNDVYLWSRATDLSTLVSRAHGTVSTTANGASGLAFSMSADGRYLAYQSIATDLILGVGSPWADVYLFDRQAGTHTLVSRGYGNPAAEANGPSEPQAISADGRHVVFSSAATDLLSYFVDQNGVAADAWSWDRANGAVTLLSHQAGWPAMGANGRAVPRLTSADGRFVTIESEATNLIHPVTDDNDATDAFLWDRAGSSTVLLSGAAGSPQETGDGASMPWAMSADGAFLTLETAATDLVEGGVDANGTWDVVRMRNPVPMLFSDGFESGGTGAWSAVFGGE